MQQICLLASQMTGGGGLPGAFGTAMTPIAGQWLNVVLRDLVNKRNLKVNRVTQTITFTSGTNGPFPLEADYLRTYDMFYPLPTSGGGTSQGMPQMIEPLTTKQYDMEFKDPSMANYPYFWSTDISTQAQVWTGGQPGVGTKTSSGNLFIYPQSSGTLIVTHRYMRDQPDYATVGLTPEINPNVPWFPDDHYLIYATAAKMATVTGDERQQMWEGMAVDFLHPYLIMEGDEQQTVHQIGLDPRAFHYMRNVRMTKSYPFP